MCPVTASARKEARIAQMRVESCACAHPLVSIASAQESMRRIGLRVRVLRTLARSFDISALAALGQVPHLECGEFGGLTTTTGMCGHARKDCAVEQAMLAAISVRVRMPVRARTYKNDMYVCTCARASQDITYDSQILVCNQFCAAGMHARTCACKQRSERVRSIVTHLSEQPWYFSMFFKAISPFIDKNTKEKIEFISAKTPQEMKAHLSRHFDMSRFPE